MAKTCNFAAMDLDAIVIGGGACGLMCAVQAGYLGKKVVVLEVTEALAIEVQVTEAAVIEVEKEQKDLAEKELLVV